MRTCYTSCNHVRVLSVLPRTCPALEPSMRAPRNPRCSHMLQRHVAEDQHASLLQPRLSVLSILTSVRATTPAAGFSFRRCLMMSATVAQLSRVTIHSRGVPRAAWPAPWRRRCQCATTARISCASGLMTACCKDNREEEGHGVTKCAAGPTQLPYFETH
jgi:hypothetical protein